MDPVQLLQRLAAGGAATPGREELIAQHNKMRESMLREFPKLKSFLKTTSSVDTKPVSRASQPRPFGQLSPIAVRDLQPGTTHRGRVLRGKLIVEPILMTSIATLLEDEQGGVVRVSVVRGHVSGTCTWLLACYRHRGMRGMPPGERCISEYQQLKLHL